MGKQPALEARMRVRLLGTGGAANETRHQAGLLVEWGEGPGGGRILLDTGSGLDIVRLLIAAGCDPAEVYDIFVSHQHTDHVGGLEPLLLWSIITKLRARRHPPSEETRVYAEQRVLAGIEQLFGAVATAVPTLFRGKLHWVKGTEGEPMELRGNARLTMFLVDHEPANGGAMGCVIERDGTRLAYSGDTRPARRLIEAASGVDVLIHESGGLDAQAAEIHRLGHSTAGDAGRVAAAAGVGRLILTHLPADHLAEPMLAEARAAFAGPVEVASDLALIAV
jgi:ribonuclease BN (tRNA processing enzyme)